MDFKEVKGKKRYLYDSVQEFRIHHPDEVIINNWRVGKTGIGYSQMMIMFARFLNLIP